jgi:hypothetical protein
LANNSDRSIEIPVYIRLDKKSHDQATAEIKRVADSAVITTSDLRARRGLPPRVSRAQPNLDMRQVAEMLAFNIAGSMGDSGKLAKGISEKLSKTTFNLALPKLTFDSQNLLDIEELPETIDQYRDIFNQINDVSLRLSKLTGVQRTDIDLSNINESQLFEILNSSFSTVQKRIIPGLQFLETLYDQTLQMAGQYNIPVPGNISQMSARQQRSLPRGAFREFQENARTRSTLEQFRSQFDANPEAFSDVISKSIETWGKRILQDTLDNLRELPEGEQSVEGAAFLERAGDLQALELEPQARVVRPAEVL